MSHATLTKAEVLSFWESLPKGTYDEKGPLGLFVDMPELEYHAVGKAFPYFSYSFSKEFRRSPEHGKHYLSKVWDIDPDREKFKASHALVLEPNEKDKIRVVDGVWGGKTAEGKENKINVLKFHKEGKVVVKKEALEDAKKIAERIGKHSLAGAIIRKSKCEVSLFWEVDGVRYKCRIDILCVDAKEIIIGDLKNFGDVSKDRILNKFIDDNCYFWQMWFYSWGVWNVLKRKVTNHFWIMVEDKAPHGVRVKICTDAMLQAGESEMSPLFPKYKICVEDDVWPGYPEEADNADLPSYRWDQIAAEEIPA